MVSINYRLGMLGFLSLADTNLPGNMGLLDQVMALKWVQTNIKEFGGDPDRVTIMGESAGSWSAFYHMMSPLSKGLFQQVIGQSGTVMSPNWMEYTEDEAVRYILTTKLDLALVFCLYIILRCLSLILCRIIYILRHTFKMGPIISYCFELFVYNIY